MAKFRTTAEILAALAGRSPPAPMDGPPAALVTLPAVAPPLLPLLTPSRRRVRQTRTVAYTATGTVMLIVGGNAARLRLLFATTTAGDYTVWPGDPIAAQFGYVISVTHPGQVFDYQTHGELVRLPWYGAGTVVGPMFYFEEVET